MNLRRIFRAVGLAVLISAVGLGVSTAANATGPAITLGTNAAAHCYNANQTGTVAVYAYNNSGFTLNTVRVHTSLGADQVFSNVAQGKAAYATYQLGVGHVPAGSATITAYAWNNGDPLYKTYTASWSAVDCIQNPSGTASANSGYMETSPHNAFVAASYTNTSIRPVSVKLNTPYGASASQTVQPGASAYLKVNTGASSIPAGTASLNTFYRVENQNYFTGYSLSYNAVTAWSSAPLQTQRPAGHATVSAGSTYRPCWPYRCNVG